MKVDIENFQSIGKATLTFTGLSVIVGPSNHGKSAVLRAIEGVLFNRPGEHIVRKGAQNAYVTVDDLPGLPARVVWGKGKVNRYGIGADEYTRVGANAPQPLQDAGYRDVWIGDAANKKGESIRPQVGEQFEPLFLLTRNTGFVADVLGLMSRHHVVATAQDRCGSDLRSAKQRLGVRRGDLDVLDSKLAVLDVVPVIGEHVRAGLQAAISRAVNTLTTLRQHRMTRLRLQTLPAVPPRTVEETAALLAPARVIAGVKRRRQLATVVAPSFKPLPSVITGRVEQVRALVAQRREALDTLFQTQQTVKATEADLTGAQAALISTKVCPTCGQSMSTVGV